MPQTMTMPYLRASDTDWRAAVYAGLIAGVVFMILEMMMVWLFLGQSPWGPPRMIAAIMVGRDALPPPATFHLGYMLVAMVVHFILAAVYGALYGWIMPANQSRNLALTAGAVFGFALFLVNFYPIAAILFPWFAEARNWVTLVSHIIFGVVLGWSYAALLDRRRTRQRAS